MHKYKYMHTYIHQCYLIQRLPGGGLSGSQSRGVVGQVSDHPLAVAGHPQLLIRHQQWLRAVKQIFLLQLSAKEIC
jgi:hypothetical protein